MIEIVSVRSLSRPRICITEADSNFILMSGMAQPTAGSELIHVGGSMAKSSEIIVMDMLEFIQMEGGHPKMWYVGGTDDAQGKLFDEHQVHYQSDAWIYRTAASEIEAQRVQEYFLEYGLDGRKGTLRSGSYMVYAYRKGISTEP
jgi:hypothetical protein